MSIKSILVAGVIFSVIFIGFSNSYIELMTNTGTSYTDETSVPSRLLGNLNSTAGTVKNALNATQNFDIFNPNSYWVVPAGMLDVLKTILGLPGFFLEVTSFIGTTLGIPVIYVTGFSIIVLIVIAFAVAKAFWNRDEI